MSSSTDRSAIDQVLQAAVDAGAVPSVAAIAADRNGVIYEGAAGPRAAGSDDPLTVDTHFRIMSMTKMVATTAALQQVEKGALDLDAPIADYCPEFADVQVLDGWDGDTPRLRAPKSQATVKQLVTHTSGLGYWFWSEDLVRWEAATSTPNVLSGANVIFTAPLLADPGTSYVYGINTDWLGKVVEAAAGTTLDVAIKDGITGPLGMTETAFQLNEGWKDSLTPVHIKGEDGWVDSGIELNQTPEYFAGGHGLYSTPRDYIKFQQALLGGGEFGGVRILQQATVDQAFTNQIGDLDFPPAIPTADPTATHEFNAGPGYKWGLGLLLNTQDVPGMRRAYSGAWAGLANTHFWVDPTTGVCGSIYSNFLPFVPPEALELYANYEKALYASL
ncbi:beta-lactamase family protein [Pseudonocardia sp. KRD-184]|uniref:Beta-lactamase family protein n=1 Tax=Pseudonocardia oceani TaxID=2792013 RepID=A0ABS6UF37_9PSEU|nr:serine hydrolase domain-containing protein [Pseudonocardia oceani]MBW0089328.1 beta-lactamase family protein [Pseudonocardia oceani]MBW0096362.1 beta-lactamase family protein [Pseudonocardia oceani]MBW0109113.1 beta-lactamase family protein [Pseudonocardia oceani]MBW0123274.1 beta-lactamase family protein [Pseudonocardia oceani]MBW0130804.1 beta-lactamase family protein [Pseudonocardia oceani]